MWDLIVLGDIPGTGVHVTFENWLYTVSAILWLAAITWCLHNRVRIVTWWAARVLRRENSSGQLLLIKNRHDTLPVQL